MSEGREGRPASEWMLFGACWLPFAWLANRFWMTCDDAYISFRYARHWAAGEGLRYNLGEQPPVEGFSNFLWVAIAAGLESVGLDMVTGAQWLGFACGSVLLWRVFAALRGPLGVAPIPAALAVVSLSCFPPYAAWSSGGLETMAFALLIFLLFERLILAPSSGAGWWAGGLALATAMTRVEGALWGAGIAAVALLADRMRGRPLRWWRGYLVVFGVGFAAYWSARAAYFGEWLPNTVHAKGTFGGPILLRGLDYSAAFVATYLTPLAAAASALLLLRGSTRPLAIPLAVVGFAAYAYAIAAGGDFMFMGRFLVPSFALHALLLGGLAGRWWRSAARIRPRVAGGLVVVTLIPLLTAFDFHVVPESLRARFHFRKLSAEFRSETEQWEFMRDNAAHQAQLGHALRQHAGPGDSVVYGAIGAVGYFSELTVHDLFGLVDPEVARREVDGLRSPGHDKGVPFEYFADRDPTFLGMALVPIEQMPHGALQVAQPWRQSPLQDRFVAELLPFPKDARTPTHAFVVRRLVREGEDAEAAWQTFLRQLGVR